ncbi:terpenoid synthase [Calocera cornea HHB12733]|uniref:Terpene synthase n=1 Tax=Calocera cornea HHB12733 TaxID=1353952 RepID=A0A165EHB2_9BASI|nr:terpenoid synthase [Calocera cornea HHB12733]
MLNDKTCETVIIPDLLRICEVFPFGVNPLAHIIGPATDHWLAASGALDGTDTRIAQAELKAGLSAAMCWPWCSDLERLQVCADWNNILFQLDDLTDQMGLKDVSAIREAVMGVIIEPKRWSGKIERGDLKHDSLWQRIQWGCGALVQERFERAFDDFFIAVTEEAELRKNGVVPSFAESVARRRDNGAVRGCIALVEYAHNIEIPAAAFNDLAFRKLEDAVVDLVEWHVIDKPAADVHSFGKEMADGHTHNLVIVLMYAKTLSAQDAMNCAGELIQQRVDEYLALKTQLPSWDEGIDRMVKLYVDGMEYWIAGAAEWSFWTKRYFGDDALLVKATRIMPFEHPKQPARLAQSFDPEGGRS